MSIFILASKNLFSIRLVIFYPFFLKENWGYSSDLLFKEASRPFAWRTACKREFLLGNGIVFDETVKSVSYTHLM